MRVIVIGNSRDLLDADDGERIDGFDRIIRLNSFRLNGHERQVGSRIDIVSICLSPPSVESALRHSADLICQARELWTPSWRGQFSDAEVASAMAHVKRKPEDLIFCDDTGHKDVIMRIYGLRPPETEPGEGEQARRPDAFYPTTGFQTIHLAEARFPRAEFYITGFGLNSPLDLRRFDTSGVAMWKEHDIPMERRLLIQGIKDRRWKQL
jgi:Glycosyltransferase family 29 (sialyltransferase)